MTKLYPIPGFEGRYGITKGGSVYSYAKKSKGFQQTGRWRKCSIRNGYKIIGFTEGTYKLHRLMCLTFLPNPLNKPVVNHINGNKLDNRLSNLEWATSSENGYKTKKRKSKSPSTQYKNICKYSRRECYASYIRRDGKRYIKEFKTLALARDWLNEKCRELNTRIYQ